MVQMNRLVGIDVDVRVEWTETNGWEGAGACAQWRAFDDVVELNEASVQQIHQIGWRRTA